MKQKITLLLLMFFSENGIAQIPDWSTTVASIIYNNCSSCHHAGAIAPFTLMSYQDAVMHAGDIQYVVASGIMPPWPPDPAYRHFAYEAVLDSSEKAAIDLWINNGMPLGDTSLAPLTPVFSTGGTLLDTINFIVQIPPYTLQFNTDEYRYFAMHSNFIDTVYVSKIEVIPGLPNIVHHADIHYDLSGMSFQYDSLTLLPGFSGGFASDYYMNAWQPGGNIASYPSQWGIAVPPGADFVFEIHYGPGGQGLTDSTKMHLRFITNPQNVRTVHVGWLLNNPIPSQGPLIIPADTVIKFNQRSVPMPVDRSLISICPHMHMLGKSYKVWFKTTQGDSVPLIDIPDWNMRWQKYYMFQQIQKIPAGARIYSEAVYDNTANNPNNPHIPPIIVTYGPNTHDEMLMTYFIFADYHQGDENILLDSNFTADIPALISQSNNYVVYPVPAKDYFVLTGKADSQNLLIRVTDILGNEMEKRSITPGSISFSERFNITNYPPGLYFIEILSPGNRSGKKLIKWE